MSQFRFHICFKFVDGPWGGGNQFLKSLRKYFERRGLYENEFAKADVILFNSHHCLKDILNIKRAYPEKIFVHRVDGPIVMVRGRDGCLDKMIFMANDLLADGTVFQSMWSQNKCHEKGMKQSKYEAIIMNAPDPDIFYPKPCKSLYGQKIRIVATSWSDNVKKGFDIYSYLDEKLNFSRYEMTFVGNSPIKFRNIRHVAPLPSNMLAEELRRHDIFLAASIDDPCSNALIEALRCGLPAVVRNSGGHTEIINTAGVTFKGVKDVCKTIDDAVRNYDSLVENIKIIDLKEIGYKYLKFIQRIYEDMNENKYTPKKVSFVNFLRLQASFELGYAASKFRTLTRQI